MYPSTAVPVPFPLASKTLVPPLSAVYQPFNVYPVFEADIIPAVEPISSVYTFVVPYFGYTVDCDTVPSFSLSVNFGYFIEMVELIDDVVLWLESP